MGAQFVQQRFSGDCQLCCLAMFLGVSYEEVVKHVWGNELVHGLRDERTEYILGLFEADVVIRDVNRLDRSQPAVLTVPSLNHYDGGRHVVYWDGERVWDPNQGVPGKKTYTNQAAWEAATKGYQSAGRRALEERDG